MADVKRIAIVNRGEAAVRCMRAIRELRAEEGSELTAIALYADPERAASFVRLADEAISLGPALRAARGGAPRPVYLDRARVLAALRATHADTVWPGWGFVAEDPEFVEMLEARGIAFLGPSSATMRALGDKIAAKLLAEKAGVPVAAWSGGPVAEGRLGEAAQAIGFPLLIKATAGGGGRGIRVVREAAQLGPSFASATSEATHAFGNGDVFLEKLVPNGRHIEVQIAADLAGHCVALGLRDCSVQRRHQKIIEEAPPPNLDPAVARALRDSAVRLARTAGYRSVGTVEFLLDPDGRSFYFLEINPRLQVEHGLTEMLTGVDLVKLQIRIARGEPVSETEPEERGHAIEARVCAEDPEAGFMPAPGKVVRLDVPTGPGVRVDSGVSLDTVIPSEFDPMIAKVLTHAATRQAACARMACALTDFRLVLEGGATNKGALLDLLEHPDFRRGGVDINWLEREAAAEGSSRGATQALMVAAILSYLEERATARLNFLAEASTGMVKSVPTSTGQSLDLTFRGEAYRVGVWALGDWRYALHLDGRECVATLLDQEPYACQLVVGNERFPVTYARSESSFRIEVDGRPFVIGRDTGGQVRASAPSVVIAIDVQPGDHVGAGQRLGLLETMKIEIAFTAPIPGTVKEVCVRPNERVAAGTILMVLQPDADQAAGGVKAERLALPDWIDPLRPILGANGAPDLAGLAAQDLPVRERAVEALGRDLRRLLLGYDVPPEHDALLLRILQAPVSSGLDAAFLHELAELRDTVTVFAQTEVLFSRAPDASQPGVLGPSNDARLRLYSRRLGIRGAGIAEPFLAQLRQGLSHFGLADLTPGEPLERALMRLYATRGTTDARYRITTGILRLLTALARAGVNLSEDRVLEESLTACLVARGQLPDTLADAAVEARYAIFEQPRIQAQAAAATQAVEEALAARDPSAPAFDLETLSRLADSPGMIFERIARWIAEGTPAQRDLALEVLVLRRYAPLTPLECRFLPAGDFRVGRMSFADYGSVLNVSASMDQLPAAWDALRRVAAAEPRPPVLELLVPVPQRPTADELRARLAPLLDADPPHARRVCLTALEPAGSRVHVTFENTGEAEPPFRERTDLMGLHPETARRIELRRLAEFDLQRLPSRDPVYAFRGRSRSIPDDERIFVVAEARAAVPGVRGGLHEAAFQHAFLEAARTLRNLRAEGDQRKRTHWNRITILVRPPLYLDAQTVSRLVRELNPASRHLGLEKVVVRVSLIGAEGEPPAVREIVVAATSAERVDVSWREPHHAPLRPASRLERAIATARLRGLTHPTEVVRLFLGETAPGVDGAWFEEFDLAPEGKRPTAVSVRGRARGENTCGVVLGIIGTPTAKHPEGMQRVLVISDPTHDMGALAAAECDRLVAAMNLAEERGLPFEWVTISSGARISMDSGTENLDATARVVRRIVTFTQAGGEINVIVSGVNVGAQSYFDALATMLLHTRGILVMTPGASMVLTGRRALEASGSVAAEDEVGIGGFERIMGPSGQAQYYARDLGEAYRILLEHYRHTYVAPGESRPRRQDTADPVRRDVTEAPYPEGTEGFATVGQIFGEESNPGRKRPFAMRPVMQAVIDADSPPLERWSHMAGGETAIVWDAHVGGYPTCLIGIESRNLTRLGYRPVDGPENWSGGTLFPISSKKVARALNAASGNRPVVVLANLSGFDGSPESMRKLQLEYGAEIARAVVNFDGPILFVVVSRYHGGAYVVFSRALNDRLTALALEGSYASVIGGGPAATVVFAREVRARTESDPRVASLRERLRGERDVSAAASLREELERARTEVGLEKHGEIAREFDAVHCVERAREVGSLDGIIPAAQLRGTIVSHFETAGKKPRTRATRRKKST